ncbi:PrgI family protein [Streptomyces sp. NPDC002851]
MPSPDHHGPDEGLYATRIPADISRPDRLLGPFTARQTAILTVVALVLYGCYWATRPWLSPLAYLVMVVPVAGAAGALALGKREGIGLDRFAAAAWAHARAPKRQVHAPEGVPPLPEIIPESWRTAQGAPPAAMDLPCTGITPAGALTLGRDGHAAVATCTTVNFDLRSATEQQGLTAAFARWLNSLTGPTQLLVRCHRTDLAPLAHGLQHGAAALPHPALEQAARAHAGFLNDLATSANPLARQIVLTAREPHPPRGARTALGTGRERQRLDEAARALAPAEVTVTPLDAGQTARLIGAACNPDTPITSSAPIDEEGRP